MTVTGISSTSGLYEPPQTTDSTNRQTFQTLVNAVQSGNLQTAQQAYTTLSQSLSGQSQNPLSQDFAALGQAIQGGNPTAAQQALEQLQSDAHKLHGRHERRRDGDQSTGPVGSTASPTVAPSGAPNAGTSIPTAGATIDVQA